MKRLRPRNLIVISTGLAAIVAALVSGCDLSQTNYGGTGEYATAATIARDLLRSSSLVARITPTSAQITAGNISLLQNSVTTFTDTPGPVDFVPDVANLATLTGGLIRNTPPSNGVYFRSSGGQSIFFSSSTVFVVAKPSSRGEFVSVNPSTRTTQAMELKATTTNVVANFYSSVGNTAQALLPLPTTPLMIVGSSFSTSSNDIDLSVNGTLAPPVTIVGSPVSPSLLARVMAIGSSVSGDQADIQEILIFNRALTKSEHGAILQALASKYQMTITIDPAFSVVTGSPQDANFAPVQSIVENKCTSCHTAWSGASASFYVSNGLVIKGNALSSKLYYRLNSSQGPNGPKNMPQSGFLNASEVQAFQTWIANAQ